MSTHRITHWHVRYRILGGTPDLAAGLAERQRSRLDGLARGPVAEALAATLDRALANDPAVYVIRRLRADCTVDLTSDLGGGDLARRWAGGLARTVVRTIRQEGESGNVRRFADEADHLAEFVRAVLSGRGADAWYFDAFARHRRPDVAETVMNALGAAPQLVPGVFRALHRQRKVGDLVGRLDDAALDTLWRLGGLREAAPSPEAARPLFAAALRLLGRLAGVTVARPEAEQWFLQFLTEAPVITWADGSQLVSGTLAALRFLVRRTRAALTADPDIRRAAVAAEPWLDGDDLLARLPGPAAEAVCEAGTNATPALSPRLRDLLGHLRAALAEVPPVPPARLSRSATALRWYAALLARRPEWTPDPATALTIQTLLTAAARLAETTTPGKALQDLRYGRKAALPRDPAVATVADMGAAAAEVVEALLGHGGGFSPRADGTPDGVESACAGALLLLRTALDVRLPAVVRYAGYPPSGQPTPFAAFLLALLHRWAGAGGDELDAGARLLFPGAPTSRAELAAAWQGATADDHRRARLTLGKLLLGQRLLDDPRTLRLDWLGETGTVLVGDREGTVHLWGRPAVNREELEPLVREWVAAWADLVGAKPTVLVPAGLADLCLDADVRVVAPAPGLADPGVFVGGLGSAEVDFTLGLYAAGLVRLWARWLKHLGGSSLPYLLEQFIRRRGRVRRDDAGVVVELDPRPLDLVLQMSDYLSPLRAVPWLDGRDVRFVLRGGR